LQLIRDLCKKWFALNNQPRRTIGVDQANMGYLFATQARNFMFDPIWRFSKPAASA
jgi:hypothetical protein